MAYQISNYQTGSWKVEVMTTVKTLAESVGWTTVENGYADATYTRWVFKSPAADFHVMFFCLTANRDSASTTNTNFFLYATACEDYSLVNHTLIRPANSSSLACSASNDSLGTTEYTSANVFNSLGYEYCNSPLASSGNTYAVCVTSDYIWIIPGAKTATYEVNPVWVGRFTSLVTSSSTNDAFRFIATNPVQATARATRSAMNANKASHSWALTTYAYTPVNTGSAVVGSSNWDLYQGGVGPTFSPVGIRRTSTSDIGSFGGLRGTFGNSIISGPNDGSTFDTATVSGIGTYVKASSNSYPIWFLRG